ncbi:MAG: enoyl-CoA hydratase/isomerase family protein [Deltaproteobacteria bacterium]|nr:enoyl-CoA hydratase/isomerase family protein [Deltaproteobacteria bacterium]
MGAGFENVSLVIEGTTATVTVDRPKVLNALNRATLVELLRVFDRFKSDEAIRAVVLTGAGEKAFVAGADISEMSGMTSAEALRFAEMGHELGDAIERLRVPVVAAVNGFALGGGCELALACDFIYASDRAKFGQPEVALGVIPGFGGTQRLARRVGIGRAREMVLLGAPIDATKALAWGLVNEVVPAGELLPRVQGVAKAIASKGPLAVAAAKRIMHAGADVPLAVAHEMERQAFAVLFDSKDQKEGMAAFGEKRAPAWCAR